MFRAYRGIDNYSLGIDKEDDSFIRIKKRLHYNSITYVAIFEECECFGIQKMLWLMRDGDSRKTDSIKIGKIT